MMSHIKLISVLKVYGFSANVVDWIKKFINNRTQVVGMNNVYSNPLHVTSGVPQGSVIGPLLFTLIFLLMILLLIANGLIFMVTLYFMLMT